MVQTAFGELGIEEGVYAADEEAGDAGDLEGPGFGAAFFEGFDVGVNDGFVAIEAEEKGDVDVDAVGEALLDGGHPRRGSRGF